MWEGKTVTAAIAMDSSFKSVEDWREARYKLKGKPQLHQQKNQSNMYKWEPPDEGVLKINVDASFFRESEYFTVGMVLRNHRGSFIAAKNICLRSPTSVFEAEA